MAEIPKEVATKLCQEIRRSNHRLSFSGWWCWGCVKFSHGNPAQMCFSNRPDYRGCGQVNARYNRLSRIRRDPRQLPIVD